MKNEKLKLKIKKVSFLFCVLFCFGLALPLVGQAGEQFEASVFLNNIDKESINAIEGKIIFPADILDLKEIRDGNSIISFWVERPSVSRQTDAKQERETYANIVFSGIVPGGYIGENGLIFSAVFEAKKDGTSTMEIKDAKILLNDGKGTAAKNAQISILQSVIPKVEDSDFPEDFKPEIAQNAGMFNGKWFLVFATQDKISGIDGYAVHESRRMKKRIDTKEWVVAESPYVLKDQDLKSFIYVKAIDKAGNERIAAVEPRYPLKWYGQPIIWSIIILGIIILYYTLKKILWKK